MTVTQQQYRFRAGDANSGFVRELWLLRERDVLELLMKPTPGIPLTVPSSALVVNVGALLTHLVPPTRSATAEVSATTGNRAGVVYESRIELTLPKPGEPLLRYLYEQRHERWLVIFRDYNAQAWLAGVPGNGLRMGLTTSTSTLRLSLAGRNDLPFLPLETADPAALFPDAAFDYSFDLSFDS
ncbi:hypothetical protein F5984_19845 [Rudanella paleaurantiibacter]|uniref:Uncharacterized protein n=1 Tax=Rudanella paleaurantiibacter TaxID=2614655 RepID=A0A7J5TV25_9BACT|nr:hypothetical protein [Rudanella paleaurantiibacter]KAB7728010.1 hypothetical protein F5984_19845 [Rudanella paleaurantiibacter]